MKINDFLLCTFQGDTQTPPTNYVAEITGVDTLASKFNCRLVDTGQQFTFQYSFNTSGPWQGTDNTGTSYIIDTHDVYTAGATDPYPQGVALVTFADNNHYLCYIENVSPSIDVIFYHYPYSRLSFDFNTITKSDWDTYAEGNQIISIEGYVLSQEAPAVTPSPTTGSSGLQTAIDIHYYVFLVPQPDNNTCWAASSAMILSYWRDVETSRSNPSYSVQEIKDQVSSAGPQYDISKGLKSEDTQPVGDILNLNFDYPMCYGVEGFASLLNEKGPIVFIRASMGGKGAHAIAVIGMKGDGTPDGTIVETLNPSPVGTGATQNVTFTNLMSMMEQLGFWDQTDWSRDGGMDRVYVMYRK